MEYIIPTITIIVIAIILFALLASIVRIVPQSRAYVIEWLGAFRSTPVQAASPRPRPSA